MEACYQLITVPDILDQGTGKARIPSNVMAQRKLTLNQWIRIVAVTPHSQPNQMHHVVCAGEVIIPTWGTCRPQ